MSTERIADIIMTNFNSIAATILSFFLAISYTTIITIIPSILAIAYWIPKIKYEQVNKFHDGKWTVYFKFLIGLKGKKK